MRGDFPAAAATFSEFLAETPTTSARIHALHFLGRAYLAMNRPDEAIAEFERLVAESADPVMTLRAHEGIARARFAKGEWDAAFASAKTVADASPDIRNQAVPLDEFLFFAATAAARALMWDESQQWFHELLARGTGDNLERARIRTEGLRPGQFAVQLGLFADRARAEARRDDLKTLGVRSSLSRVQSSGRLTYALLTGEFFGYEDAEKSAAAFRARGIDAVALP